MRRLSPVVSMLLAALFTMSGAVRVARAEPLRELYRGARAQAMGNAFTALADDEQAIFYNPAGLAGIQKHAIHYFVSDLEISRDIIGNYQSLSTISSPSGDAMNAMMGKNTNGRAQLSPSFVMPNFGVAILLDQQFAVMAKNQALPNITLGYQATNGVQVAYGVSLLGGRRRNQNTDLRLGVGGKVMWRRGGFRQIGLTQMLNLDADSLKAMFGSYGRGLGFDVGLQSVMQVNSRLQMNAGIALTEIGDMKFLSGADTQKGNLSAGVAFKYRLPQVGIALAYDYRHILDDADWRKKFHLGSEFQLPMLSLYFGLNQLKLSYGVAFDAWLVKVTALTYTEELGTTLGQDPERRFMLRLALKFGL
ncbi:MAG: hypothetical protein NDJ89_15755 [Oligoflexia bacterium]|nr:hypothetical protein [Oligoflexia bacterium]